MSITDGQNEIVSIGGIHALVFKLSIWLAPLVFTTAMGFQYWMMRTIITHDTEIAVMKVQDALIASLN